MVPAHEESVKCPRCKGKGFTMDVKRETAPWGRYCNCPAGVRLAVHDEKLPLSYWENRPTAWDRLLSPLM